MCNKGLHADGGSNLLFYLRTSSSSAKLYVLELSHISKLPLGVMQREREGGRERERERERLS